MILKTTSILALASASLTTSFYATGLEEPALYTEPVQDEVVEVAEVIKYVETEVEDTIEVTRMVPETTVEKVKRVVRTPVYKIRRKEVVSQICETGECVPCSPAIVTVPRVVRNDTFVVDGHAGGLTPVRVTPSGKVRKVGPVRKALKKCFRCGG
jgi:hypothetical protein